MSEELTTIETQFVVPYWMQDHLLYSATQDETINWASHPKAGLRLYARTPVVVNNYDLLHVKTVDELDAMPGWLPISGNLTSKSHRQEMGDLFYQLDTAPDETTQVISLVMKPLTGSVWEPALLEEGHGWEVTTGVHGIEQETVVVAVMYLDGLHAGVVNPILSITDQGLGGSVLLRGGAMYGMTKYAEGITPSVLTNKISSGLNYSITGSAQHGHVISATVSPPSDFKPGDLVYSTIWFGPDFITNVVRVDMMPDQSHPQWFVSESGEFDLTVADLPGVSGIVRRINYDLRPGTMLLDTPAPAYEPSNVEHTWLRPQRMNLLANPNFIGVGNIDTGGYVPGWKTGWTISGSPLTILPVSPPYAPENLAVIFDNAHDGVGHMVVESNLFPVLDNNFISFRMQLFGGGTMRVGVVSWDLFYKRPVYIRLPDVVVENAVGTYEGPSITGPPVDVVAMLPTQPGTYEYNLRLEWVPSGTYNPTHDPLISEGFVVIQPLVDPTDGQSTFFSGDTNDGLPGDYHWHGGLANKHFSMYYNNRKNTEARLFAGISDNTEDKYKVGLLNEWTPSSSGVVAHWDAMEGAPIEGWTGDYFYPIKEVHTDPVLHAPWQEFNEHLLPFYPDALTDQEGGLIRDSNGDPIILVNGILTDDLLVNEFGDPIMGEDDSYLLVP